MLTDNIQFNPFAGPEIEHVVYTTNAQSEIWAACYFGGKDAARAFNESISVKFNGTLDVIAIENAVQKLVERHESLRSTFSTDGTFMTIYKKLDLIINNINFSNLEENDKNKALDQYLSEDAYYLFDLLRGPLLKIGLLKFSEKEHLLIITAHHIICDGWSIGIMLQELGALYSAIVNQQIPNLPLPIPFSKFSNEELLFSKSEEYKNTDKFWHEMYQESIPVINLPIDFSRPSIRTYKGNRLDFPLDDTLLSQLKQTGLGAGVSLVTTLLASFEIFLNQLTGQDDLIVGLPYAGQPINDMNQLMGHCVNLLPLRSRQIKNLSFIDYLKQRKSELFNAYDYPKLTFGHLLQKLKLVREASRIPLVPVVFNIDIGMTDGVHFANLDYELISNTKAFETFEIFLNASGTDKNLVFEWSYNEALFNAETINEMMLSFEKIIQKIVEDPSKTLSQITFQDFSSGYKMLNATKSTYPKSTLHELFTDSARQFPEAIALNYHNKKISYNELDITINQMSHYLWSQGLRPGQIVAISLERSPELIASFFAILQCGASYVPIDTLYPEARLNLIIEDAQATFYIGLTSEKRITNNVVFLPIATILDGIIGLPITPINQIVTTSSPAYMIYTSGSTGKPKGVQVAHSNVINLIYSMAKEPGVNAQDKILSTTTISFDAMVMEIYLPLLLGACVVLVDNETRSDGQLLLNKIVTENITLMWGTPSIWQILLDSGWTKPIKIKALVGGEPVSRLLANELLAKCSSVWNIYGPTETTVCSVLTSITEDDNPITIGKPIANTQVYLLNIQGGLVKAGEVGEIAIAGDGVSLGYLNRPELNNERFVDNPFNDDKKCKMYLSGDLGKLLSNGKLQCLGRIDKQVKLRGYRIELGEIEHSLLSIKGIKSAIVIAENDVLIAFIMIDHEFKDKIDIIQLFRSELTSQLPTFMVPQVFHILEKMPTTLNDKIDQKALLAYGSDIIKKQKYTGPRTENEKIVAAVWKEILNINTIDIYSNFFEIGGHSIKAVKVMIDLEKHTRKRFPLSSLFEHSTIEKFAKLLNTDVEIDSDCLVAIKPNGNKAPLFIIHGAGLNVLNFINFSKHFDEDQPIYGLQGTAKKYDDWYESIEAMATHYIESIVKIYPEGPYALAGFSFGGVVAFEMTRQLKEQGKKVILTALLDTYVDTSYYYKTLRQKKLIRYFDLTLRRLDFLKEMLTSWNSLKLRTNGKKEYLLKKYFGHNNTMTEQETLALEQFTEANHMVNIIVDRYHIKPQDIALDLFRSKDDMEYKLDPEYMGWKKATLQDIIIHNISGNHLDIVSPPNDKVLARLLQDILDKKARVNEYKNT